MHMEEDDGKRTMDNTTASHRRIAIDETCFKYVSPALFGSIMPN